MKNTIRLKSCLLAASLVSAAGIATSTLEAAIIAQDQFLIGDEQYAAADVVGQNPAVTGFTGAWVASQNSPDVIATGLSYSGVASSGGALQANTGDRAGHLLTTPFTSTTTGTFYMSFMLQFSSTTAGTTYRAFELYNGGFTDATQRSIQVGLHNDFGNANLGVRVNNNNTLRIDLGAPDLNTNFFVLRFDFNDSPNGDSLTVWRNPTDLALEAASTSNGSLSNFNMEFDRMALASFVGAHSLQGDEFRIGTTWQDVTTVPEPGSALLGGIGLLALLRRRR